MEKRNKTVERSPTPDDVGGIIPAKAGTHILPTGQIELHPIRKIQPHPDNPRTINKLSSKFTDLVESIRANGILEPLTVREFLQGNGAEALDACRKALGVRLVQVLSGHRRLEAAKVVGLDSVPIRSVGTIADDLAYDIVAMANLHEDLTPLEEGKRAATWLDKYGQDAKAVASKLGKSEHWVLTHAMIERNLIQGWKHEAQETGEKSARRDYSKWTAAHWVHIARLPAAIQEHWLQTIQKDYRFDPHDATAEEVGQWLETEKLFLAKATFPSGEWCAKCAKRTDAINQLLWQDPDVKGDSGDAVRCLDPKCWKAKEVKQIREAFRTQASGLRTPACGVRDLVPISLSEEPEHWEDRKRWQERMKPVKKAFGQDPVTADRITVVKEGAKGAVPGIVVAGRGKGKLQWVKIAPKKDQVDGYRWRPPTAEEIAEQKKEEEKQKRWQKVIKAAFKEIASAQRPTYSAVLLCCLRTGTLRTVARSDKKEWAELVKAHEAGHLETMIKMVLDAGWNFFRTHMRQKSNYCWAENDLPALLDLGPLFGIDANQRYHELAGDKGKKKELKDPKDPKDPKDAAKGCIEDCQNCELEVCAKTGCLVDQEGRKKNQQSKIKHQKSKKG